MMLVNETIEAQFILNSKHMKPMELNHFTFYAYESTWNRLPYQLSSGVVIHVF